MLKGLCADSQIQQVSLTYIISIVKLLTMSRLFKCMAGLLVLEVCHI